MYWYINDGVAGNGLKRLFLNQSFSRCSHCTYKQKPSAGLAVLHRGNSAPASTETASLRETTVYTYTANLQSGAKQQATAASWLTRLRQELLRASSRYQLGKSAVFFHSFRSNRSLNNRTREVNFTRCLLQLVKLGIVQLAPKTCSFFSNVTQWLLMKVTYRQLGCCLAVVAFSVPSTNKGRSIQVHHLPRRICL